MTQFCDDSRHRWRPTMHTDGSWRLLPLLNTQGQREQYELRHQWRSLICRTTKAPRICMPRMPLSAVSFPGHSISSTYPMIWSQPQNDFPSTCQAEVDRPGGSQTIRLVLSGGKGERENDVPHKAGQNIVCSEGLWEET